MNYEINGYDIFEQKDAFTGEPITKTKRTHPYSYQPFEVYCNSNLETTGSAYSDRMISWDYDKFTEGCQFVFGNRGQSFGNRSPKQIEDFLRYYFCNNKLTLTRIVEGCNVSNGYPYWVFSWNNGE